MKIVDHTGKKNGRLTIVKRLNAVNAKHDRLYVIRCECGTDTIQPAYYIQRVSSCRDCSAKDKIKGNGAGEGRRAAKRSWYSMVARVEGRLPGSGAHYTKHGIKCCARWQYGENGKSGFECFYEDMGDRPEGTTLDRADTYGHYELSNCRWATAQEQTKNRRPRTKKKSKNA